MIHARPSGRWFTNDFYLGLFVGYALAIVTRLLT